MTLREVKRQFISCYYGTKSRYLYARRKDYCKVQFEWSCFIDGLCKDGQITQKQYDNAVF